MELRELAKYIEDIIHMHLLTSLAVIAISMILLDCNRKDQINNQTIELKHHIDSVLTVKLNQNE